MMKTADLKKALRKCFVPEMKALNYVKTKELSWMKKGPGPFVFSIQLFPSPHGGYCWIEAGVHLDFIPLNANGKKPDMEKLETIVSMFSQKLTNKLNDRTDFIYGEEPEGLEILCDYLFWAVRDEAEVLFSRFSHFPEPFIAVTIDDLKNNKRYEGLRFGNEMIEALELSRIHLYLGNQEKATEFADYGLGLITGMRGSGLIPQFEAIRNGQMYLL